MSDVKDENGHGGFMKMGNHPIITNPISPFPGKVFGKAFPSLSWIVCAIEILVYP